MPQPQPQIPSQISTRGVGTGVGSVGGYSRYRSETPEDPQEKRLRLLAALQNLDLNAREGDVRDTTTTMNMLKLLSDIQETGEVTPARVAQLKAQAAEQGATAAEGPARQKLLESQAGYYDVRGQDLPEERNARALELALTGLDRAYAYDPQNPEYKSARRNILQAHGYNFNEPAGTPTKSDVYGPGSVNKAPGTTNPYQKVVGSQLGYGARENFGYMPNPPTPAGPASLGDVLTVNNPQLKPQPDTRNYLQKLLSSVPVY